MSILKDVNIQSIQKNLPSFYQDYVFDKTFLNFLFNSMIETTDLLAQLIRAIGDNAILSNTELLRTIPFFLFNTQNSVYDAILLSNKYPTFNSMTTSQKLAVLAKENQYDTLDATRTFDATSPPIVDIMIDRLIDPDLANDKTPYRNDVDYAVVNSNLFLFSSLAAPAANSFSQKSLLLKNIHIDHDKLQRAWGLFTQVTRPPYMSRQDYATAVQAILKGYLNGPTIPNLRSMLNVITGSTDIVVTDKFSPNMPAYRTSLWTNGNLHEFDFIVTLPANFLTTYADRLPYMRAILNAIKPSYSNYVLYYPSLITDTFSVTDTQPLFKYKIPFQDSIAMTDTIITQRSTQTNATVDTVVFSYMMDEGAGWYMDNIFMTMDDTTTRSGMADGLNWNLQTYPQVPRQFSVGYNTGSNYGYGKFQQNSDATTNYELWRSTDGMNYSSVASGNPAPDGNGFVVLTDSSASSLAVGTTVYYKVRASGPDSHGGMVYSIHAVPQFFVK